MVSHGGSFVGFRAEMIRFPDEKLSVACLCNLAGTNPTALALQVADLYLEDAFGEELARFAGEYYGNELGVTYGTKSRAPRYIASTAREILPQAVITTIGGTFGIAPRRRRTSRPSRPDVVSRV